MTGFAAEELIIMLESIRENNFIEKRHNNSIPQNNITNSNT